MNTIRQPEMELAAVASGSLYAPFRPMLRGTTAGRGGPSFTTPAGGRTPSLAPAGALRQDPVAGSVRREEEGEREREASDCTQIAVHLHLL